MIARLSSLQQATLITLAVIVALSPLTVLAPGFRLAAFGYPAARLAALFLGAGCVTAEEGYWITHAALPVLVSPACSGISFFVLVVAMGLGLARRHHRHTAAAALVTTVLAYALTLLTNTCRITLGWHMALWARRTLPSSMWAGVHLSVGVLVFLSALIGLYALTTSALEFRCSEDTQKNSR